MDIEKFEEVKKVIAEIKGYGLLKHVTFIIKTKGISGNVYQFIREYQEVEINEETIAVMKYAGKSAIPIHYRNLTKIEFCFPSRLLEIIKEFKPKRRR